VFGTRNGDVLSVRHAIVWVLLGWAVIMAPLAALLALILQIRTSRLIRGAMLTLWSAGFLVCSFSALIWLPSIIFPWYESGRWPAPPLGHRQFTVALDSGATLSVRGREIRHATPGERDWWWDLLYQRTLVPTVAIGNVASRADSLPIRVERSDGVLALLFPGEPTAFFRTPSGRFMSYSFSYPFLSNETYWRNLTWSMRLNLVDIERMHRDLDVVEQSVDPAVTISRCDLQARQFVVRYRWPSRVRIATFSIDRADGRLTLVGLVRTPVSPD
jgi:hypothetical protein